MKIQNFASNLEICIIADLYDFFKGGIGGGGGSTRVHLYD